MTLPISASHRVVCSEHHRPLQRGINAPSSPVPPRFGGFLCPFPKISWCGFVSLGGFLRPIHKISKYFLARGNFFSKMWREFWRGSRASSRLRTRGVGLFSVPPSVPVPSCRGACLRPVSVPVPSLTTDKTPNKRPANGVLLGRACSAWVGWFYMPVCVPCQDGNKGRKFSTQIFKPVHVLCSSCPVHH